MNVSGFEDDLVDKLYKNIGQQLVVPVLGEEMFVNSNGEPYVKRFLGHGDYKMIRDVLVYSEGFPVHIDSKSNETLVNIAMRKEAETLLNEYSDYQRRIELLISSNCFGFFINLTTNSILYSYLRDNGHRSVAKLNLSDIYFGNAEYSSIGKVSQRNALLNVYGKNGNEFILDNVERTELFQNFDVQSSNRVSPKLDVIRYFQEYLGGCHFLFLGCSYSQGALMSGILKLIRAKNTIWFVNATDYHFSGDRNPLGLNDFGCNFLADTNVEGNCLDRFLADLPKREERSTQFSLIKKGEFKSYRRTDESPPSYFPG